jgi:magnesium-transporting ATPase (P-type)
MIKQANLNNNEKYNKVAPQDGKKEKFGIALNGKTLKFLYINRKEYESLLINVLSNAKVYARISPEDKSLLVSLI